MKNQKNEKRMIELAQEPLSQEKLNKLLQFCIAQSDEIVICPKRPEAISEQVLRSYQLIKTEKTRYTHCTEGPLMTMYHFKMEAHIKQRIMEMKKWYAPIWLDDNDMIFAEDPAFYKEGELICSICSHEEIGRLFLTEAQYKAFREIHIPHECYPPHQPKNLEDWLESCVEQERERITIIDSETQTLPDNIGKLVTLKTLEIFGHDITHLPKSIENLTNLECLRITGNQVEAIDFDISKLKHLKILDLSDMPLKTLPEGIFTLTHLEELYLGGHQIENIPEQLMQLPNLKVLVLPKVMK